MHHSTFRAAGYRRVSMREQVDGHSLDAQAQNIRQYVAAQGWSFVELYTDAGLSAKKDSERPELQRLLDAAAAGQFDVIVVDKIDRFYRHLGGLLVALDQLNAWSVSFASVQERLDFTTPWGKLTLTVLGMLAEIYIDNLRQETRKGKHQRARKGLWNGTVPYGYCKGLCSHCADPNGAGYCPDFGTVDKTDGKVLIPHPIDSIAVKLAYEWYATGEYSDTRVTDALQAYEHQLPDGEVNGVHDRVNLLIHHLGTHAQTVMWAIPVAPLIRHLPIILRPALAGLRAQLASAHVATRQIRQQVHSIGLLDRARRPHPLDALPQLFGHDRFMQAVEDLFRFAVIAAIEHLAHIERIPQHVRHGVFGEALALAVAIARLRQ